MGLQVPRETDAQTPRKRDEKRRRTRRIGCCTRPRGLGGQPSLGNGACCDSPGQREDRSSSRELIGSGRLLRRHLPFLHLKLHVCVCVCLQSRRGHSSTHPGSHPKHFGRSRSRCDAVAGSPRGRAGGELGPDPAHCTAQELTGVSRPGPAC